MSKKIKTLHDVLSEAHQSLHFAGVPSRGFNIHSRTSDGDTPLHIMAMRGDRYAVELLVSGGAEVNAAGDMGYTPLHLAATYDRTLVVEYLLAHGADAECVNEFGQSSRHIAAKSDSPELRALFRKYKSRS